MRNRTSAQYQKPCLCKRLRLRKPLFFIATRAFPNKIIIILSVPITRAPTLVTREAQPDGSMVEGIPAKISWSYGLLGTGATRVTVEMARYMMRNGKVTFHSFYTLVANQENSGRSQFVVRNGEGQG